MAEQRTSKPSIKSEPTPANEPEIASAAPTT